MEDFFCCSFSFRQTALTPLIPATPQDLNTNNDGTVSNKQKIIHQNFQIIKKNYRN